MKVRNRQKVPAANARFGATAAVTPQKVTCEHERKYPAERLVDAATTPSRHHVIGKRRKRCRNTDFRSEKREIV